METIKKLKENYKLGLISATDFVDKYTEILALLGSPKDLMDARDALMQPLAEYLIGITEGSGDWISRFAFHLEILDGYRAGHEVVQEITFNC